MDEETLAELGSGVDCDVDVLLVVVLVRRAEVLVVVGFSDGLSSTSGVEGALVVGFGEVMEELVDSNSVLLPSVVLQVVSVVGDVI